jgi:hypothetical protein
MKKRLTRVIRCVKKGTKKRAKGSKKSGYDMSYRDSGPRPQSKSAQNARFN